jgi:hypothetical protein
LEIARGPERPQLDTSMSCLYKAMIPVVRPGDLEVSVTKSERRIIEEILKKKERGEKITEREERMVAYSPYGTAARSSFAPVAIRIDAEREE